MQTIENIFELSPDEIAYRISALSDSQREILSHIVQGKFDEEVCKLLSMGRGTLNYRIFSAIDRVGAKRRSQLVALYAIWKYANDNRYSVFVVGAQNDTS